MPLLEDDFGDTSVQTQLWKVGVIATKPETFDPTIATTQSGGALHVTPQPWKRGSHYSGYVSTQAFDLRGVRISAEVRPSGSAITIFAAASDAANGFLFRIHDGNLVCESRIEGKVAARRLPYDSAQHRFLRLRVSDDVPVIVWETSANGTKWTPQYLESLQTNVSTVRVGLSAGTDDPVDDPGEARFDNVRVESKQ